MTEFIGSRISLISKRDIRYVGTLHEISSENSTVALEQVVSFGTEGRRPDDEVPASDNVYEYIVFRGSDVKDLRIEEGPRENNPPPPQVPDDPAILGSARRQTPATAPQAQAVIQPPQTPVAQHQQQSQVHHQSRPQQPPPPFPNHNPFHYPYPPPNQRFGPQGFQSGPAFHGMPYGAPPPGWYPPPGYGFPAAPPGPFHPNQLPIAPPGQFQRQPIPQPITSRSATSEVQTRRDSQPNSKPESPAKPVATVKLPDAVVTPVPASAAQSAPPPPTESKPDVAAALAPPAPAAIQNQAIPAKAIPTGPKSGRLVPVVPLPSPNIKPPNMANGTLKASSGNIPQQTADKPLPAISKTIEEANRDARAAVAAAMAKLPPAPGQKKPADTAAMDNLTRKVNEMRTNDNARHSRQPGTGGYAAGHRGGGGERGAHRGGRRYNENQGKKMEVPTTDYDFESANAKFNKQDLVKEAIATGSPVGNNIVDGTTTNGTDEPNINGREERKPSEPTVAIPAAIGYNKTSSFFDNISSEIKDRTEEGANRLGGREFRSGERQKNLETFGQGSVDNGYRGGFGRGGRGRGRGYGRGRGARGAFDARGARNGVRGGGGAVASES